MEFRAKISQLTQQLNKSFITLVTTDTDVLKALEDKFNDIEVVVIIKQKFNKRSIAANNYAWKLIELIANELRASKEELYIKMLKLYGQIAEDEDGNKLIFSVQSNVNVEKLYKYVEIIGYGEVNGKEFTHYKALKGSSEFNSREMSIFIDGIISEAKELGIETLSPEEVARMKEDWQ